MNRPGFTRRFPAPEPALYRPPAPGINPPPMARLPALPGPPPAPEATAPVLRNEPPARAGTGIEYEAWTQPVNLTNVQGFVPLFTTKAKWTGVDIYVQTDATMPVTGVLTIYVQSVAQGGPSSLVATGRFGHFNAAATTARTAPKWICGARSFSERFNVLATYTDAGAPTVERTFKLTIVASNDQPEVPENIGAISMADVVSTGTIGLFIPTPRVLRVQGVNTAGGAARYLHLHDLSSSAVSVVARAPLFVWPLGNTDGAGGEWKLDYRCYGIGALVASSTPLVTTIVADCAIQGLIQ